MKEPKLSDVKLDTKGTKSLRRMIVKSKKTKITINIDEDLLFEIRKMADSSGTPYQTLLNKILKDAIRSKTNEGTRLDRLEREIERLKRKIAA